MKLTVRSLFFALAFASLTTGVYAQTCANDNLAPACFLFGTPTPNKLIVKSEDINKICAFAVTKTENVTLGGIPTKFPVPDATITATKIFNDKKGSFELTIEDCCGHVKVCDPVLTSLVRAQGRPVVDTFFEIAQEEGFVKISNGSPGLRNLAVVVNGERFQVPALRDNEEIVLDVTTAMKPGLQNMLSLVGYGKPGGSASILIWDGSSN